MRCKRHLSDLSGSVGVCASCLRERLSALIAAQAQAQQAHQQAQLSRALSRSAAIADQDPRKSDPNPPPPHPPPLAFPRSVSPYVSRRKSDGYAASAAAAAWGHNQPDDHHHRRNPCYLRFYSTPQVGPTFGHSIDSGSFKKKKSRFSLLSNLFRSRSDKFESDPRVSYRDSYATTSSPSPSWFSAIFASRKDRSSSSSVQSRFFVEDSPAGVRHRTRTTDRGMSPARGTDFDYDYDEDTGDRSPSGGGYSSESSPKWKKTPTVAPPSATRSKPGQSRNISGLAFCLSPLVRASPNRHWNQKGMPPEIGKSGEGRVSGKPHLSNATSFCKNRSRKLADFGRANHNR